MNTKIKGVSSSTILGLQGRIDDACDRFEISWKASVEDHAKQQPRIEDHLVGWQEPDLSKLLRELVSIDVAYRQLYDSRPTSEQYEQRFPNHVDIVKLAFSAPTTSWKNAAHTHDAGQWMGKYRVINSLGRGGQATTHLVFDPDLQRRVVIKQYHATGTSIEREAVLNEGRSLARVKSPYVAQCLSVERADDEIYLVMEYIRGKNLADTLKETPFGFREAAQLVAQVAQGLGDVHVCGLLHRDVKPANIIVCDDGTCRLVDFGLASPMTSESLEQFGGTLQYMSPEQARSDADQMDQRSDVFGLGAVLYQLLTGTPPYDGKSQKEVWAKARAGQFQPPRAIKSEIPERLERICLTAMAPNPAKRFKSADAFGRALRRYLRAASEEPASPPKMEKDRELPANPYKGLAAYTETDAPLFFGRDEQIERLWNAFRDLHTEQSIDLRTPRILPIVGPSGCGKSSLVRAGLIAELHRRPLPGRENTHVLTITPGMHPLESLAVALARVVTGDSSPLSKAREFEEQLRSTGGNEEHDGLRRIADLLPGPRTSVLLVIDQFEELYSLCVESADGQVFIESLLNAAADRSARVSAVLTLRSDFLGQTQDHPLFNALISEKGLLVPSMNETELRLAISEPAARAGSPLDDGVIDLLVNETKGREGALPLLQFALTRIWEGLRAGKDAAVTLREIGGVGGALAGEAQRIHNGLDSGDQRIARRAFLAMVQLGEGARDTRRRASIGEISAAKDDPKHVHAVLSRFAAPGSRLVTMASNEDGMDMVEITHEALLEHWPALRQWLDESRDDIRFHRRLADATRHWNAEGRPHGLLWRSPDLDYLRRFHERSGDELTVSQTDFSQASEGHDKQQKRKEFRRLRLYQATAVVIGLLACAAGYFGIKSNQAARQALNAKDQAEDLEDFAYEVSLDQLGSYLVLGRGAQDELKKVPGRQASEVRSLLLRTAFSGLDKTAKKLEEVKAKSPEVAIQLQTGLYAVTLATTYRHQGDLHMGEGKFKEALESYTKCRGALSPSINSARYKDQPWLPLWNLARAEDGIGNAYQELKEYDDAKSHFFIAHEYRRQWLEMGENTDDAKRELADSALNLGELFRQLGDFQTAQTYFLELLELRREFANRNPNVFEAERDLGGVLRELGTIHKVLGEYEPAIKYLGEAVSRFEDLSKRASDHLTSLNLNLFRVDLGEAHEYAGDEAAASELFEMAATELRALHRTSPDDYLIKTYCWWALYRLAMTSMELNQDVATALYQESLELVPKNTVYQLWTLARCHRPEEAAKIADQLVVKYAGKPKDLFEIACGYALCAWSIKSNSSQEVSDDEQRRCQQYITKAIETLKAAIDIGYRYPAEIKNNPDLAAIRGHSEYSTLLELALSASKAEPSPNP